MKLRVEFQRRQVRPSQVEQFQTPEWALDFGEAQVKTSVRGVVPGGWASLCLVRGPGGSTWNGQSGETGTLCCVPPGEELDGRTEPGFEWMTLALPPSAWAQCRALAGLAERALHRYTACPLPARDFARIERQVRATYGALQTASGDPESTLSAQDAGRSLAMHLATLAGELAGKITPPRDSLRNRTRLARRAQAWMREHLAEPWRVPDVCLALSVSRRELEYAFRTTFDQSPREFVHSLRLNAIRRVLLRADPGASILRIALDYGMNHPSRFAADYRALFGESPSETLRA
ncbi:MAG: AraC family transcriptional regulator [Chthoniobacter sp.]